MKKGLFIVIIAFFAACTQKTTNSQVEMEFGQKIDTVNAINISELNQLMKDKTREECIIKGKIIDVCQSEGCWLNLENSDGGKLFVKMKDHSFTVPKDIAGRSIYVRGLAILDTTSVEMLKDYAADAGKSEAEVQAITKPEVELIVEASGVVLLKDENAGKK